MTPTVLTNCGNVFKYDVKRQQKFTMIVQKSVALIKEIIFLWPNKIK
mgnify:CR=1 FL=1